MKKLFSIFALVVLIFILSTQAASAIEVSWLPLVPCGLNNPPANHPEYAQPCNKCDFLKLGKNLTDMIFLGIVPIVGTLLFLWAGFNYMLAGAYPARLNSAKAVFWGTVQGIFVVSLAWAFTNTLITSVAKSGVVGGATGWWNLTCTATTPPEATPIPTGPAPTITGGLTEQAARALLDAAKITVNHLPPQTTLVGIKQATLDEIIRLKAACGCAIEVTGGTETTGGHTGGDQSHLSGNKIDVAPTTQLDAYVKSVCSPAGARSNGDLLYSCGSATYARETNPPHWDILVP